MSLCLDFYSRQPRVTLDCFRANSADGIARYLVDDPWNDPRALLPQEVEDAHAAGLYVLGVYEMNPTYDAYFTAAQGRRDAAAALAHLDLLGYPEEVPFFFAVDVNVDPEATISYFNAINSAIQCSPRASRAGVYAFQAMVEFARERFGDLGKHLWQTYGSVTGPLDLWQHEQRTICGVEVDLNDCSIEGWGGSDQMTDQELLAALKRIYSGPDSPEEWVKADVRVMVAQDPETQAAIRKVVADKLQQDPETHAAKG